MQSFDVFFDLCLKKGQVNNPDAGDLKRHRADYDVTAMKCFKLQMSVVRDAAKMHPPWRRAHCIKYIVPTNENAS